MELEFSRRKADLRVHTLTTVLPFWKLRNSTEGLVKAVTFQGNWQWALLGRTALGSWTPGEPGHLRGFRVRDLPSTPAPVCDSCPFTSSSAPPCLQFCITATLPSLWSLLQTPSPGLLSDSPFGVYCVCVLVFHFCVSWGSIGLTVVRVCWL